MTASELAERMALEVFALPSPESVVEGAYCGDLLSWVMGRAEPGCAWFTIMSNQNVAAVAVMADISCVILTEEVRPDPQLIEKAEQEGINLLGTSRSTFDAAVSFAALTKE
ncbi:MAG: hypothetical protein II680_06855 [Clostridia bacterium]|nr:hypothetical protein [Clostridia bacterium]